MEDGIYWFCTRCRTFVDKSLDKPCNCEESPSPWTPIKISSYETQYIPKSNIDMWVYFVDNPRRKKWFQFWIPKYKITCLTRI